MGTSELLSHVEAVLNNVKLIQRPFPHFSIPSFFDHSTASEIRRWLKTDVPWHLESQRFYVQHGASDLAQYAQTDLAVAICSRAFLQILHRQMERIFSRRLDQNQFTITAHRLLPGHRIGVHNDCPSPGRVTESHRLIIHFNDDFDDSHGGHLALFSRNDLEGSLVTITPDQNRAVAMEFSANSWHCVEEVRVGERYSLLYSFWPADPIVSEAAETIHDNHKEPRLSPKEFDLLFEALRNLGAERVHHTTRKLSDHLVGTFAILTEWGCEQDVCKAGLFHSVCGTPSFPHALITESELGFLRQLIGERSSLLVRIFAKLDSASLIAALQTGSVLDNGRVVVLTSRDLEALVSMVWANQLEQAPYEAHVNSDALREIFQHSSRLLPSGTREQICRILLSE